MIDQINKEKRQSSLRGLFKSRIGKKLILYILLFSGAVTFFLTTVQIYLDYRFEREVITQKFEQLKLSNLESLENAVWQLNKKNLQLQLDGILRVTDIVYLKITDIDGSLLTQSGLMARKNIEEKDFSLNYEHLGKTHHIGTLHVQITLTGMYDRLINTAILLLISQGVKTFLVSVFILYIFQYLVTRHLLDVVNFARRLEIGKLQTPFYLYQKRDTHKKPDEIDQLVDSLEGMRSKLDDSFQTISNHKTKLEFEANHDSLTQLPNRLMLIKIIQKIILEKTNSFSLIQFELKHFKEINDTLGHSNGDQLLIIVARRVQALLQENDLLARIGNNEFIVLLCNSPDSDSDKSFANNLKQTIIQPTVVSGISVQLEICSGASRYPEHGKNSELLLGNSDVALMVAQAKGLDSVSYSEEIDLRTPRRFRIMSDLHSAIDEEQFTLYYQPQIDCASHSLQGIEALIRWNHPELGLIPPDEFLYFAELGGIINQISLWVIRQAIKDLSKLIQSGIDISVSINISEKNMLSTKCNQEILSVLKEFDIPANKMCVEITENSIMSDPETIIKNLKEIQSLGLKVSIDDYGTGYSSLSYLRLLPANELKIDRSFVMNMHQNEEDRLIIKSTIELAHELGLEVLAEGVEMKEHADYLTEFGCDQLQGYFISRPVPFDDLKNWIENWDNKIA